MTTHVAHVPSEPQSPEPPESNRSACRRQRRACPGGEGDIISIFAGLLGGGGGKDVIRKLWVGSSH